MSNYIRHHFGAKLFLSYLAVVAIAGAGLVITSQSILPTAFSRHMMGYAGNGMMGMGAQGMGGAGGPMAQLYLDFRAGFNDALTYATLAALLAAILLSILLSRSVTGSLRALSSASLRIAEGHYEERVAVGGADELAQLAWRFNQMAEKLDQVESMRRQLIADVSHELRTPLTAIKGSMEGLIDGVLPADNETYEQIHAEADRLNRLVDDLQELSRVEAGAAALDLKPLELGPVLQTVGRRLAPQFQSRHIELFVDAAAGLPRVLADADRTVQVLTNLVGNALQYTPEGGKVWVEAKRMGAEVHISVRDTGIGIPPEHQAHIFDRFYRVDKSRSRQAGGGSGIGLTIARALVEAQGGRIWVESAGPGQGSTFAFTLLAG